MKILVSFGEGTESTALTNNVNSLCISDCSMLSRLVSPGKVRATARFASSRAAALYERAVQEVSTMNRV